MFRHVSLILVSACLFASQALAGSTQWHAVEGGAVRLVLPASTEGQRDLRGAIEIRLEPGWKTYWLDPGSAGVPPSLEVETANGPAEVEIGFPPPRHFDDENGNWAGYDGSVALPFTLRMPEGATAGMATARIFLGICETICIPVQADWSIDLDTEQSAPTDDATVEAAFATLPQAAQSGFGVRLAEVSDKEISVTIDAPASAKIVDLFVAGTEAVALGRPEIDPSGRTGTFVVPVVGLYGKDAWHHAPLRYTLVTSEGSVSGVLKPE